MVPGRPSGTSMSTVRPPMTAGPRGRQRNLSNSPATRSALCPDAEAAATTAMRDANQTADANRRRDPEDRRDVMKGLLLFLFCTDPDFHYMIRPPSMPVREVP